MSFQVKKFNSLIASMINWISSNTGKVTDFNPGSVVRTILEAVAMELEELYYQLLQATQEAIEEAIYRTFNFPRNPAEKATGQVRFYRLSGTEFVITIPISTLVGTDAEPSVVFETLVEAYIPYLAGTATGPIVVNIENLAPSVSPTLVTWTAHGLATGQYITFSGITQASWSYLNGRSYPITYVGVNSFTIGVNSSAFGAYVPGTDPGKYVISALVDSSKNFLLENVTIGSIVKNVTDNGQETVTALRTTTNPNDTLLFAPLSGGASFAGGGDSYKVIVPYKDVGVSAVSPGTEGNVSANSVTVIRTNVPNVGTCANLAAFTNGLDEETDTSRKSRFSLYINSLARATRGALEYAAKTVTSVVAAKAIDDVRATVFYYDNSTQLYTDITDTMRNPVDTSSNLFPPDQGGNDCLYIGGSELYDYVNIHLGVDGIHSYGLDLPVIEYYSAQGGGIGVPGWKTLPCTDGTDIGSEGPLTVSGTIQWDLADVEDWLSTIINQDLRLWIRIRLAEAGPYSRLPKGDYCSLPPGFGYVYLYCHDGSGELDATLKTSVENVVELYRGCGIIVVVKDPLVVHPTITLEIVVAPNFNAPEIASKVQQAIADHLNAKVLGEDLYIAELYQLIMDYNDQAVLNCQIADPVLDNIVASSAVLRAGALVPIDSDIKEGEPTKITVNYTQW